MTQPYTKAYEEYENTKKLYYYGPQYVKAKTKILSLWREHVAFDALEVECPLFVPIKALQDSGHVKEFSTELFMVENTGLCLRPEAAISVFPNIKSIVQKYLMGQKKLSIAQYGRSFRNQKTTRDRHYRIREFDQMEVEILTSKTSDTQEFFKDYEERLKKFFNVLDIEIYVKEVSPETLPHYAVRTRDFYFKDPQTGEEIELGCLSNRSNHDLKKAPLLSDRYVIYQCSLGLTRIVLAHLINLEMKNSNVPEGLNL